MPRTHRRLRILVSILAIAVLTSAVYFAVAIRRLTPHHHASAPTLTPAHLRTIETVVGISFPQGSTLQHATLTHGKDTTFFAQINAPAASLASWPGPPAPPFRAKTPEKFTEFDREPAVHPWFPRSLSPIRAQWSDNDGNNLTVTDPDDTGTVLIFLGYGGDRSNRFPETLLTVVPHK